METFPTFHEDIKKRLNQNFNRYAISAGQLLGTAQLFKKNPAYNKYKIISDWVQFLRIQEDSTVKLGNVDETLYIYYINSGSMTKKKLERTLYSAFLRDNERRRLRNEHEYNSLEEYLKNYWKRPSSFVINTFFLAANYFQQFIVY